MTLITSDQHTELQFQYMSIDGNKETLLQFLVRRFRYHDDRVWQDHISHQRLWINDKLGHANQILKNGQKVTYLRPDYLEPDVDRRFEIVYEDDAFIAVNKSGNLPTSPSGKYFKNTLAQILAKEMNWNKVYTLHRLDRETSGLLLFAKTQEVAQLMAEKIRKREIEKEYIAIVHARTPLEDSFFVSVPIGRSKHSAIRIKQAVIPNGKMSQTSFEKVAQDANYAQLKVKPLTGRTHQIRVHCAYLGLPILGDKLYSLQEQDFIKWINDGDDYLTQQTLPSCRQMLHASQLTLQHPITQQKLVLYAPTHVWQEFLSECFEF